MKPRFLLVTICALLLSAFAWAQLRQVAIVELPGEPGFDGIAYVKGNVVIAHSAANTLDVFDTTTRRLVKQVAGMNNPRGLAVDEDGGLVYVANAGNDTISEVSAGDWSVRRSIKLTQQPEELLLVGHRLYTANWLDRSISIVDLGLGRAVASIDVHGSPQHMVFDPKTQQVFATLEDTRQVVAIGAEAQITRTYPLLASQPTGLAIDAGARRLYVAVRYAVAILDADTGREVGRVAAPAGTNSVRFDPVSGTVYVAASDGSAGTIRRVNGSYHYDELKTDIRGNNVALDPNRNFLYMPGARQGRAKLVILKPITNPPGLTPRGAANALVQTPPPAQPAPSGPLPAEAVVSPHR